MSCPEASPTVQVTRERADAWPLLCRAGAGAEHEVLSFTVLDSDRRSAVGAASYAFAGALARSALPIAELLAVAHLGQIDTSRALVRRRLEREGVWGLTAADSVRALRGERTSWIEPDHARTTGTAYGAIRLDVDELPHALTRFHGLDAVVIGFRATARATAARKLGVRGPRMFESALHLVPGTAMYVARTFGAFDDRESGVDVVAVATDLDQFKTSAN